MKFNP